MLTIETDQLSAHDEVPVPPEDSVEIRHTFASVEEEEEEDEEETLICQWHTIRCSSAQ